MIEIAFWSLVAVYAFVYAGYPVLLWVHAALRPSRTDGERQESLPRVTLLISAYNEAGCIGAKLDNTLALDYPRDLLEVIVISDASDDGTDEIVRTYESAGVKLLRMPQRGGKTLGLNAAVAVATGDIIVFSDANALYRPDAIRWLVAPFSDPQVGAVIGESTYVESATASGQSESLYWRYETWIKALESRHGSVVGGDGAIYATRRSLYEPMPADALSDFVNPLQIVRAGFRCVYEPRALSYEETAESFRKEYRRKVRIVNRAWRALWSMREMLNPFRYGTFALKLWSHKVLRWWAGPAALAILVMNVMLVNLGQVYRVALAAQVVFYALAATGWLLHGRERQPFFFRVPYYFCLVNAAAAIGLVEAFGGRVYTTWSTARGQG